MFNSLNYFLWDVDLQEFALNMRKEKTSLGRYHLELVEFEKQEIKERDGYPTKNVKWPFLFKELIGQIC